MSKTTREGWQIQQMGVGCWGFGNQYGSVSDEQVQEVVDTALELGLNFFDTADAYGTPPGLSEERLARALGSRTKEVLIASKAGNFARRFGHPLLFTSSYHVHLCCDASLHRLKRDTIDVYLCHLSDPQEPEIWIEAFQELKEQGKIRAWGISTNNLTALQNFNQSGECSFVELDYSLLNREPEEQFLPYCREKEIATIIRGPLHQGVLSGRINQDTVFEDSIREKWNIGRPGHGRFLQTMEKVDRIRLLSEDPANLLPLALGYVLSHPDVTVVIPGAKNAEQVLANAVAQPLPEEMLERLRIEARG